jgi:DNA-binding transcriptional LysR family regulator
VRLEVQVGVSADLIAQIDAGTLDVVFAKRPWGTSRGRFVWREPLVWAAADTFELVPGVSLPLALYREHSVSREAALEAVRHSERAWHIVFTSPSLTGVRAAALAGLAVTPLPASAVGRGSGSSARRTACRRFRIWISRFSRGPPRARRLRTRGSAGTADARARIKGEPSDARHNHK